MNYEPSKVPEKYELLWSHSTVFALPRMLKTQIFDVFCLWQGIG